MKMKNRFYILLCLLYMGMVSCNSWLDVQPKTELDEEEMFSKQQGFQETLTGVYMNMKSTGSYGGNLMYGTIEYLAQHWDCSNGSYQEKISRFNYTDASVQGQFETIYTQLYKTIMSANTVLEKIDEKRSVFETGMYEIIKGEALALRAYCHLDLLRLFGPMPMKTGNSTVLPYVTTVTIDYHEHHTYEEFTHLLEDDLLLADSLLKTSDPVQATVRQRDVENNVTLSVSASDFLKARHLRFNYYAVKALEARFYLWLGGSENKAKACACAKEVMDAVDEEGKPVFELGSVGAFVNEDYVFSSEHIMAVYDHKLSDRSTTAFSGNPSYTKDNNVLVPELYEAGTTDIRYVLWTSYTQSGGNIKWSLKKFLQKDENSAINQLPLLRLSEMYLIAMECGTIAEANELYEAFCIARDIPVREFHEVELEDILLEEYNKEFYAEGQTFYLYKRLGVENMLWAQDPGNEEAFVVPLPLKEVNYAK